jgi:DNA-directed RNA polymerase specialized sigma24 family protein
MRNLSPADLCWRIKIPPDQKWVEEALHAAGKEIWRQAHHIARAQLGDEALAPEVIEAAMEKAAPHLLAGPPRGNDEVVFLLKRLFIQEVRRRRKSSNRLVFVGSSQELRSESTGSSQARVDSTIDLELILQDVPPDVRFALLLRYSKSRWSEVAAVLATTESAVRLRCKRALDRIRQRLEREGHKT